MSVIQQIAALAIVSAAFGIRPLAAQLDYRNLDDHRPVRTEDAYPIERYAFELLLPYGYEDHQAGGALHVLTPELAYGVLANTQIGLKLPFAAVDQVDGTDWGFAGPRVFALHNFNTEGRLLPALALRADMAFPAGDLAGDNVQLTLKGIATRSWGRTRLHLNGGMSIGDEAGRPEVDAEPDWTVSLAADRTILRQSLLMIGELGVLEAASDAPTEVTAALGIRYQVAPTVVLDAGFSRRLVEEAGPDVGLTFGLSYTFALAGLLPRAAD